MESIAPIARAAGNEPPEIEPLPRPIEALAFVNDPPTAQILAALLGATGQGRVQFGGINAALQVLQSAPCPPVLVIDVSGLADPLSQLDRLADYCPEGTAVILVGGPLDPGVAAELRAMGIVHYLTKPIVPDDMRAALLAAEIGAAPSDAPQAPDSMPGQDSPSFSSDLRSMTDTATDSTLANDYGATTGGAGQDQFAPAADAYARATPGTSGDLFSTPYASDGAAPTAPMAAVGAPLSGFMPGAEVQPLPRSVDLLAFLTEAQSAAVVASIIGPQHSAGRVQPGGINAAIAFLNDNASPKVLLVDIAGVTEPMARIDALAEVCAPGTMVIAIGVANDVALYRDLKNAGVYEYLVKPLNADVLRNVVLEAASGGVKVEPDANKPIIMVIGTRGGVGASTIAINIAGTLAKQGKKTILLDADLQFGSIALTLDIDPGHGLREALDRPERVDSMFLNGSAVKVGENLHVLAAEEGVGESIAVNGEALMTLLRELQRHFDAIVIDLPRHVAAGNWDAISQAHSVLLVADLSLVGIRDTTRMLATAKDAVEPAKIKLMINTSGGERGAKIDRREFEAALNRKADYVLPEDAKSVSAANRAGRTVVDVAAGSKLSIAIRDLCEDIVGRPAEPAKKRRGITLFRRRQKA